MNDVILMSIKGGRYLEAESLTNQLIINHPSSDVYFLMGTIKSNLLFGKGRDLGESMFCFEKSIELSENKEQTKIDSLAFLFGIYKQIQSVEKILIKEARNKVIKSIVGVALTYFSSKIVDDAKDTFGVISGMVGASFGIGMTIDGLVEIGDIKSQLDYVKNLKIRIEEYLRINYPESIEMGALGKVDLKKLRDIPNQFPDEFYDFETLSNEKLRLTKFDDIFKDLNIKNINFLFGLKYHHQNYATLFFENYIIAISNIGLISNKYVKLDYKDMVEIKNDNKIKSYQPELPSLLFSKAIEYDVSIGNEIEIENFNLGGKDKLGRDNSLKLKKIKSGFFKNPDYTSPRNFFINCFESADSNKKSKRLD